MKNYIVTVEYVCKDTFTVVAENKRKAMATANRMIKHNCSLHTSPGNKWFNTTVSAGVTSIVADK